MATYKGLLDAIELEKGNTFSPGELQGTSLTQPSTVEQSGWEGMSQQNKMGAINAGMSTPGGIGSKLMSGGVSAGLTGAGPVGWGVAGGGLVLSLIEAEQQKKADAEARRIAAENQRHANIGQSLKDLMRIDVGVS